MYRCTLFPLHSRGVGVEIVRVECEALINLVDV